jgi:hypothetical protein
MNQRTYGFGIWRKIGTGTKNASRIVENHDTGGRIPSKICARRENLAKFSETKDSEQNSEQQPFSERRSYGPVRCHILSESSSSADPCGDDYHVHNQYPPRKWRMKNI